MARETDNNERIGKVLEGLNLRTWPEMTIDGLKGMSETQPLRYDFYVLPTPTTPEMFIEYDGVHHYGTKFGQLQGYTNKLSYEYKSKIQVIHDVRKTLYCKQSGVPLLRIPPGLSAETEKAIIKESLDYWQRMRERVAMYAEDTWVQSRIAEIDDKLATQLADPESKQSRKLKRAREVFESNGIPDPPLGPLVLEL